MPDPEGATLDVRGAGEAFGFGAAGGGEGVEGESVCAGGAVSFVQSSSSLCLGFYLLKMEVEMEGE